MKRRRAWRWGLAVCLLAVGCTPLSGTASPRPGTDAPPGGTDAPQRGTDAPPGWTDAPRPGTDAPRPGTDAPRPGTDAPQRVSTPGPKLLPIESIVQQVAFVAEDGTPLAGQIDWPINPATPPPLVVILHHSGREPRDSYQHYAAKLVSAGFAVFRFDKRGAGQSGGEYGCCEAEDALAAYRAAAAQPGYDPARVFVIAQSLGTRILAQGYDAFARAQPIAGVVLLSSLLEGEAVLAIKAPVHIIVADSEPNLAAIGVEAARAHAAAYAFGASYYVAEGAEHTLYDITAGPIDWGDPNWPDRFHAGAWASLQGWLEAQAGR